MKGLSSLCLLFTVSAILCAINNVWVLAPDTRKGGHLWIGDLACAAGFVIVGSTLWRLAELRDIHRAHRLEDKLLLEPGEDERRYTAP